MEYLIYSIPLLLVGVALASRRVTSVAAGCIGVVAALAVASSEGPQVLTPTQILLTVSRGIWISWLVGSVIFGGLFFRTVISISRREALGPPTGSHVADRRTRAFTACFLLGPFAEAATGFGVGQVTTVAALSALGLAPLHIAALGLFSQILVPWGAMANGTMVGAAFSGIDPKFLGYTCAIVNCPLVMFWLYAFWKLADRAGLEGNLVHRFSELGWIIAAMISLITANVWLGPEIAALIALGPLIALNFWLHQRPDRTLCISLLPVVLPYVVLIAALALTRAVPALNSALKQLELRPFDGVPPWFPLLHPATWLIAVGILSALALGRLEFVPRIATTTLRQGWKAVATIGVFLVFAQVMTDSGAARALAEGLAVSLGVWALLGTPVLAGTFGFITGSGNATNALLMTSQVELASQYQAHRIWIASVQAVGASALTMLSPARVSMGSSLAGDESVEGKIYRTCWQLGAVPVIILIAICGILVFNRNQ